MNQISIETLAAIKSAKVQFRNGGAGILTRCGIIITAAHCLSACRADVNLFIGGSHFEFFKVSDGRELFARVLYAELVSDVAVLGLFDQRLPKDLAKFIRENASVPIATVSHKQEEIFPVSILTARGVVEGTGEINANFATRFLVRTHAPLRQGDSGSPIFHQNELVGVVSSGGEEPGAPYFPASLPSWLQCAKQIQNQNEITRILN